MSIELPLTLGKFAHVSNEDADLAAFRWSCRQQASGGRILYYAQRKSSVEDGGKQLLLHRVILERILGRPLTRKETVEHLDGDRLNNRRENLKYQTWGQMEHRKRKARSNQSGYRGVVLSTRYRGKWEAQIAHMGIHHRLGGFHSPEEAALAYDKAAFKLYGDHAKLNFPPPRVPQAISTVSVTEEPDRPLRAERTSKSQRAKEQIALLLTSSPHMTLREIARRVGCNPQTVANFKQRMIEQGIQLTEGKYDRTRV